MNRMGLDFGDLNVEIPVHGFAVDVDIKNKRDIFMFSTSDPGEPVILSAKWDSSPHRLLKAAIRQLESN